MEIDPEKSVLDELVKEWKDLHDQRLMDLVQLGIYSLLMANISLNKGIVVDKITINADFQGDPVVRLKVIRSKEDLGIFYGEEIGVIYDGDEISIQGAEMTYKGKIPEGIKPIKKQIGTAINMAFGNPRRIVAANSNTKNSY